MDAQWRQAWGFLLTVAGAAPDLRGQGCFWPRDTGFPFQPAGQSRPVTRKCAHFNGWSEE